MDKEEHKKQGLRIMIHVIFISGPSILLPGYFVYKLRPLLLEWEGIEMNDEVYGSILLLVMWLGFYLSSNKIMKELFNNRKDRND